VWGKYIIRGADFAFIICFNKKISGHNKFREVRTKMWEVLPTNASPWLRAWIHLFHTRNKVNFSAIFSQRHGCLKYSKSVMQTVSRLMCKLFQWFPSQPRLLFFRGLMKLKVSFCVERRTNNLHLKELPPILTFLLCSGSLFWESVLYINLSPTF